MPYTKIRYLGILITALVSHMTQSMVYDNRFIPLFQQPRLTIDGTSSEFAAKFFMTTASVSLNSNQQDIGLPEIFGPFDQVELARAIEATGKPNPLPSEFQILTRIPWSVSGKRQGQGITFVWNQSIVKWLSTGFSWLFMHVESRDEFLLNANAIEQHIALKAGDAITLEDTRRAMFRMIDLYDGYAQQAGFGDIDWYIRLGNTWDYTLRFRRIDAGIRLGTLFPTGVTYNIEEPASIPFGGNGHWGMYSAIDAMFELKEDWKAGFLFRASKRFANVRVRRMPAKKEPEIFGAVIGLAQVNPGVTVIFSPYFLLENIRKGLMLGLNFTLTWHQKDRWEDKRINQTVPVTLSEVENLSKWKSEYFTINVMYDFGKVAIKREFNPIVTFCWDIPSTLFIASGINRTQRITLGLDFVY